MIDSITLTGIVATDPRHIVTTDGVAITTFRLASGQRRFDRSTNSWVDADTNWYTVSTFRLLARNVARSVQKGQHVMLTGKLRLREWKSGDRSGTSIEVTADSLGHDLNWYMTTAIRTGMTAQIAPGSAPSSTPGTAPGIAADLDAERDAGLDNRPSRAGEASATETETAPARPSGAPALAPVDF
ncbi:single-stranded DNA-binding protein [Cryobacterium melibiosiphilum]|uniref:Single-stranded DNA-binding protein n=1 Tax=Cryobacterium melibiosiphilum TaxID=995039 RepID=A0A3A5MJ37_9MICO|nr:single-stranded DNA-binding protein [Cryobacterium melibiosiphilum]RJT84624.1 single-stranded DNA-binding protein [Cryobacterium melibiosiphilum]